MNRSNLRACQGALLSLGAPLGWLLIQYITGVDVWLNIQTNILLYAYMLFTTMLVFICFGLYVGHKEDLIIKLSIIDSLTGIYNLRFYLERMQQEIAYSHRSKLPLSLIYFDLDHFKSINDSYGHPFGDIVLKKTAQSIKKHVRTNDVFARIGGEEFAILLPGSKLEDAKINAERIREIIQTLDFNARGTPVKVTISLGVACLKTGEDYQAFYQRADEQLYLAKTTGRNKVCG
jgi:diguanylate cyclase (GGDEF)-like protein